MKNKGLIFDIRRFAVHDGPGIRTTVFFKGCPLVCTWCHNPESRLDRPEPYDRTIRLDGKSFTLEESVGKWMTVGEVVKEIRKDDVFYDLSGGGVTFSGGEPLYQPDFLEELLMACRKESLHTAVDTCGYCSREDLLRIAEFCDLFLFDIKLVQDRDHIRHTGVSNRQILDNLFLLREVKKNVILRFPYIPGITDLPDNLLSLKELAGKVSPFLHRIDLLPYHPLARSKYHRMHIRTEGIEIPEVSHDQLMKFKSELEATGLAVSIGG